jgi:hypothetical protein
LPVSHSPGFCDLKSVGGRQQFDFRQEQIADGLYLLNLLHMLAGTIDDSERIIYINDIAMDIEARFGNSCQRKLPRRYALRGPGDVPTPLLAHNQKSKMKMPSTASAARAD